MGSQRVGHDWVTFTHFTMLPVYWVISVLIKSLNQVVIAWQPNFKNSLILNSPKSMPNYWTKDFGYKYSVWAMYNGGSDSKQPACSTRDPGSIPGSGRSLERGMATHSSIPTWRIPWTEETGGLQSMRSQRVKHSWATKHTNEYSLWVMTKKKKMGFRTILAEFTPNLSSFLLISH